MGSKPKKSEYKATEAEKTSASVAKANYDFFKKNYGPVIEQMRDASKSDDTRRALRGRASADTMQALPSDPTYAATQDVTSVGDVSDALAGQLRVADTTAKNLQNKQQGNILNIARNQVADASAGMAQASRLATSDALARAQGRQAVRSARAGALGTLAGGALAAYDKKQGGDTNIGKFFEAINTVA